MSLINSSSLGGLSLPIWLQETPTAIAVFMQQCQTKFAAQAPSGFGDAAIAIALA